MTSRRSRFIRRATSVAVATGAVAVAASASASAAAPTGAYADFKNCPIDNPATATCVYNTTVSGSFKLGNRTVPINKTIRLQGGLDSESKWVNAAGVDSLEKVPLDVPGGLTELVPPSEVTGPVLDILLAGIRSVNRVTATAELVAKPELSLNNIISGQGTALRLPVRIKLSNPILGNSCYVGSASNPVDLKLTSGTTAPPPPNQPITGTYGEFAFDDGGNVLIANGYRLVDNAFSVPAAKNCGGLISQLLITPIVNSTSGFPSAAGTNSAQLGGSVKLTDANLVRASAGQ